MCDAPTREHALPDARLAAALEWVAERTGDRPGHAEPVSGDASFRRYFRLHTPGGSRILMDAPPEREDSRPFIEVAGRLRRAGLAAPRIEHFDLERGFGLLEDLGDRLLRDALRPDNADRLMPSMLETLARMTAGTDAEALPAYDDTLLQRELDLFPDWYLARHRNRPLTVAESRCWSDACHQLLAAASEQPRVFVHRDFHSCNLLLRDGAEPGIIDFQDAVCGPLAYDFASLIWDRYIGWPRERLESWMDWMHRRLDPGVGRATWIRWCDLIGVQRNLKIVGIFARLYHRDGRPAYPPMIPRFYRYLLDVVPAYPELDGLRTLLEDPTCAP